MLTIASKNLMEQCSTFRRMLANMICFLVEQHIARKPTDTKWNNDKALLIEFRLRRKKNDKLSLLIWAPTNYVSVFTKEGERGGFNQTFQSVETDWKVWADHDSCWRSDGIDRIMNEYEEIFEGFDWLDCYKVVDISPAQEEAFRAIKRARRGY
jgi:hypothetical protein